MPRRDSTKRKKILKQQKRQRQLKKASDDWQKQVRKWERTLRGSISEKTANRLREKIHNITYDALKKELNVLIGREDLKYEELDALLLRAQGLAKEKRLRKSDHAKLKTAVKNVRRERFEQPKLEQPGTGRKSRSPEQKAWLFHRAELRNFFLSMDVERAGRELMREAGIKGKRAGEREMTEAYWKKMNKLGIGPLFDAYLRGGEMSWANFHTNMRHFLRKNRPKNALSLVDTIQRMQNEGYRLEKASPHQDMLTTQRSPLPCYCRAHRCLPGGRHWVGLRSVGGTNTPSYLRKPTPLGVGGGHPLLSARRKVPCPARHHDP